jgi:hypothetical protein
VISHAVVSLPLEKGHERCCDLGPVEERHQISILTLLQRIVPQFHGAVDMSYLTYCRHMVPISGLSPKRNNHETSPKLRQSFEDTSELTELEMHERYQSIVSHR